MVRRPNRPAPPATTTTAVPFTRLSLDAPTLLPLVILPRRGPRATIVGMSRSIGVMGAGAVGCFFGARLAQAGHSVTLVARPAHAEAIARDGLDLDSVDGRARVAMSAGSDAAALRGCDVVLVCVKTPDTDATAARLAAVLSPDALVVSLQNGVDNAWRIREHVANPVVPAVVYVSVEMRGPGVLRHNGGGRLIVGDPLAHSDAAPRAGERLAEFMANLADAGVPCTLSPDVRVDLWTKLSTNCAYNAISALTQLRYHHVAAHQGTRGVMRVVVAEVARVAAAEGVPVTEAALSAAVDHIVQAMPMALASMAQDLLAHRRTEIEDLNGFVVRRGAAHGIATPVNQTLHALVGLAEAAALER
jgi:2-dehydropantoate 2-reductase